MLLSRTRQHKWFNPITLLAALALGTVVWVWAGGFVIAQSAPVDAAADDAAKMFNDGRQIFRLDTLAKKPSGEIR